jgi:hypothetical protein
VATDPRTTLAQSLNAMVAAELIDTTGWELLATLAKGADQPEFKRQFLAAHREELATLKDGSIEVREMSEEAVVSKTARVVGEVEVEKMR